MDMEYHSQQATPNGRALQLCACSAARGGSMSPEFKQGAAAGRATAQNKNGYHIQQNAQNRIR